LSSSAAIQFDTNADTFAGYATAIGQNDPFEQLLPANATPAQIEDALLADNKLTQDPSLAATLVAQIAAGTSATPLPTTEPESPSTEPDPFTDLAGANASTTELGIAAAADHTLATSNPTLAGKIDELLENPAGDGPEAPEDYEPFKDWLPANPTDAQIATAYVNDGMLYSLNPNWSTSMDAQVDDLVTTPPPIDSDAFADLARVLDPTGFTGGVPSDAFAMFAASLDTALTPAGSAALDPVVDSIIAAFGVGPF
jgi:hypothetical protein